MEVFAAHIGPIGSMPVAVGFSNFPEISFPKIREPGKSTKLWVFTGKIVPGKNWKNPGIPVTEAVSLAPTLNLILGNREQ